MSKKPQGRMAAIALCGGLMVAGGALMVFGGGGDAPAPEPAKAEAPKPDAPKAAPPAAPKSEAASAEAPKADDPKPAPATAAQPKAPEGPLVGSVMSVEKSTLKYGLVVRLFAHAPQFAGADKAKAGEALTHRGQSAAPRVEIQRLVAADGAIDATSAAVGPKDSRLTLVVDAVADGIVWIDRDNDYRFDVGQVFPNGAVAGLDQLALHEMRKYPWLRQVTVEIDGRRVHEIENGVTNISFTGFKAAPKAMQAVRPISLKPGAHKVRVSATLSLDFADTFAPATINPLAQGLMVGEYNEIDRRLSGLPNWGAERDDPQTFVLRISDSKTGAMAPVPRENLLHFPADEPKPQKAAPRSTGDVVAWREYPLDVKVGRYMLKDTTSLDLENNAIGRPDVKRSPSAAYTPELPGSLTVAETDFRPAETGNYAFAITLKRNYVMAGMTKNLPSYSRDQPGAVTTSTGACGARIDVVEDGVPKTLMSRWWDWTQPDNTPGNLHGNVTAVGQRRFEAGKTYRLVRRYMCENVAIPPTWIAWVKAPSDVTLRHPNDAEFKAPTD